MADGRGKGAVVSEKSDEKWGTLAYLSAQSRLSRPRKSNSCKALKGHGRGELCTEFRCLGPEGTRCSAAAKESRVFKLPALPIQAI
jgi:hypothetical protein